LKQIIIILSDKQAAKLIEKSEAANEPCDMAHLQQHISNWLSEDERITHTEK